MAALLVCVPSQARANGGAFETSAIERSGNLVPMQKRLITLEKETLEGDRAGVYVTYLLQNNGPDDSVTFGFPIARIKKLRVEQELGEGAEPNQKKEHFEVTLPDRPYKDFNPRFPFAAVDWVVQHPQGAGFIDRVRLTILEVFLGRKYEDTAITELYLCGFGNARLQQRNPRLKVLLTGAVIRTTTQATDRRRALPLSPSRSQASNWREKSVRCSMRKSASNAQVVVAAKSRKMTSADSPRRKACRATT